jgi:hypothetical protein
VKGKYSHHYEYPSLLLCGKVEKGKSFEKKRKTGQRNNKK